MDLKEIMDANKGGFKLGKFHVICGVINGGESIYPKSNMTMQLMQSAIDAGKTVYYVDTEMSDQYFKDILKKLTGEVNKKEDNKTEGTL